MESGEVESREVEKWGSGGAAVRTRVEWRKEPGSDPPSDNPHAGQLVGHRMGVLRVRVGWHQGKGCM